MALLVVVAWLLGFVLLWRIPLLGRSAVKAGPDHADVSVIIPARNEETNLARLLPMVAAQRSPPREVLVVDDDSSDRTAAVAASHGATVVAAPAVPAGWAGKPWACWHGAQRARGRLLLFLDADTRLDPHTLHDIAATHAAMGGLLSIQPYHRMEKPYERLAAFFNIVTMAGMGAFTLAGHRVEPSGAFGPCLVCTRDAYFATGGHCRAAADIVESTAIARAFRAAGHAIHCFGGKNCLAFRMYPNGLRALVAGFAKSMAVGAHAARPAVLVGLVCWIAAGVSITRHAIAALLSAEHGGLAFWCAMDLAYALQVRWMLARIGNFGWWPALLFQLPLLFFVGVFLWSTVQTHVLRRVWWKGRRVTAR